MKLACKPGSVEHLSAFRQSFIWAGSCLPARATYPGTARAALLPPYLVLLRMGFAVPLLLPETRWALTRRSCDRPPPCGTRTVSPSPDPTPPSRYESETLRPCGREVGRRPSADYSLWHFPSPRGVRSLTGILLCGARTFLYASELHSDRPASFTPYCTRCCACCHDFELPIPPCIGRRKQMPRLLMYRTFIAAPRRFRGFKLRKPSPEGFHFLPLTAAFSLAPAANFAVFAAGILIAAPVCGLRPERAARFP